MSTVRIQWPDGRNSEHAVGMDWLAAAKAAGVSIPTGCMGGSCGACEIDVNGPWFVLHQHRARRRSGGLGWNCHDPYW